MTKRRFQPVEIMLSILKHLKISIQNLLLINKVNNNINQEIKITEDHLMEEDVVDVEVEEIMVTDKVNMEEEIEALEEEIEVLEEEEEDLVIEAGEVVGVEEVVDLVIVEVLVIAGEEVVTAIIVVLLIEVEEVGVEEDHLTMIEMILMVKKSTTMVINLLINITNNILPQTNSNQTQIIKINLILPIP
jgi:hypothetical protein